MAVCAAIRPSTSVGFVLVISPPTSIAGCLLARIDEGDFAQRVGDFLHYRLDRIHLDLARVRVEFRTQLFLGAIILASRYHHRVLDGRNDDLRLDMLLAADLLDCLVQQTRHSVSPSGLPLRSHPSAAVTLKLDYQIRLLNRGIGHGDFPIPSLPASRIRPRSLRAAPPEISGCRPVHSARPWHAARESFVIRRLHQLAIQARRTDFQNVTGAGNQVLDIEDHAQLLADALAIVMADTKALRVAQVPEGDPDRPAETSACLSSTRRQKLPGLPSAPHARRLRESVPSPSESDSTAGSQAARISPQLPHETKKWARAHWNVRPFSKQLIIVSLSMKRNTRTEGPAAVIRCPRGNFLEGDADSSALT